MYSDSDLIPCQKCGGLGVVANNLWGRLDFFHKIPSPRFEGAYTFTEAHFQRYQIVINNTACWLDKVARMCRPCG